MQKLVLMTLILISPLAWSAEHKVKMLNQGEDGSMVFEPGYLQVEPGDTVTFVPVDQSHNTHSALSPDGGESWKGSINEKVSVTLNTEGVYIYKCLPHLSLGMVGVIQVGEATNLQAAKDKAASMKGGMAMNKDRLGQYLDQVE